MDSSKSKVSQHHQAKLFSVLIVIILILGVCFSFYFAKATVAKHQQIIKHDVEQQLSKIITDVEKGVGLYEYGLQSLKSAIETVGIDHFTYQHHLSYFQGWDYYQAFPGARGFGLIKNVAANDLAQFLSQAKAERQGEFELKQLADPSDPLFIIQYIEPEINNFAAVGLDIGSEITRRTAAIKAVLSGKAQLTGPITLVQENSKTQHGFLLLLPIYDKNTLKVNEKTILGWTYAPLLIGEILLSVANLNTDFYIEISDVSSANKIDFYHNEQHSPALSEYAAQQPLNLFGRTWQVHVAPKQSYINALNLMSFNKLFGLMTLAILGLFIIVTLIVLVISNRLKNINEKQALAAMVNNLDDCIIGVDRNFKILTLNDAAADLFNLSGINNKPIIDYLNLYFPTEILIATFKRVARGSNINNMTFDVKANDREEISRDFLLSISSVYQQNKFYGATFSISDITQLKNLQNKLEKHNNELQAQVLSRTKEIQAYQDLQRSVLNSNNMAIIATDKNGVITLINRGAEKVIGCQEADIIGKTLADKVLPILQHHTILEDKYFSEQEKNSQIIEFLRTTAKQNESFTLLSKLGVKSQVDISVSDINHTHGFLLTLTDVSETTSLKKQLTLINEALNNSQDILLWCDLNGNIKYANPFASIVLGYTPKVFQSLNIINIIKFTINETWQDIIKKVLINDRFSFEVSFIDSQNKTIPTLVSLNQLQIDNEKYIYLAAKDITYQKRQAKKLNNALINADTANETKILFLSNISHELRTPLNAINGVMQLLQSTELNNKQLSYVQSARRNVTALSTMMSDILEITHSERGVLELNEACFDFNNLITKLGEHLILISEKKALEINFELPADTPEMLITDANKLLKILLSLTENAVKYTEQGLITVKFRVDQTSEKQAKLLVEVKDTGIGISEEKLTSIFNLFNQTDSALNSQYGGIGMGLALAREYIKLMHGNITVESELDVGTNIILSVDVKVKHQPKINNELVAEKLGDLNVLIVDDNPTSLQILGDIVSHLGCYTTVTDSPENALIIYESAIKHNEKFDVALIDWKMPDIDGWELAEKFRAIDTDNQMPLIVMVTAHTKQMFANKREQDTNILNGFITKPVTKQVLIDSLLDTVCADDPAYLLNKGIIDSDGPLFNKRILVVEDNPTNQVIAKSLLESQGATVIICSGGYKALFELENSLLKFDVVLMDIQMPDIDGYETTRRIKAIKKFHNLPILAMTAFVQPSDKAKCFEAGMIGHIGKPYELVELINQIMAAIDHNLVPTPEIIINSAKNDNILTITKDAELEHDYLRSDILEFCTANGIALRECMERFSHLTSPYLRSLTLFNDDLIDYIAKLSTEAGRLTNQDYKRIFHTLKSTAASLGFVKLGKCAENIDKNYTLTTDYQHTDEESLTVLNLMNNTLELISNLERLLSQDLKSPKHQVITIDNFDELIDKLIDEVSQFNMHALETFQTVNAHLTGVSKTQTEALAACLNKLKFKQASKILEQLKDKIAHQPAKEV